MKFLAVQISTKLEVETMQRLKGGHALDCITG